MSLSPYEISGKSPGSGAAAELWHAPGKSESSEAQHKQTSTLTVYPAEPQPAGYMGRASAEALAIAFIVYMIVIGCMWAVA